VLAELRERIVEECDCELEASNHRRVERFWRGHPFVLVPTVDTELSRRRVLVIDYVDGMSFDEVTRQPDAVRDRYAQIVYRFFHGTALELGVALGDPHPGNYLLGADGHVAFFDFGMMRRLPPGYLRREAVIAHGVREGEQATVIAGMRELGYLPGEPSEWDGELLLDYMREVSWWLHAEEPLRLAPEDLWRSTEALRDQDARNHILQLRRMTLPPEALLLRRMEGLLFQTAAMIRKRSLGQVAARADRRSHARRRARRPARRLAGPPPPLTAGPSRGGRGQLASGSVSQRFRPVRTPAAIQVHSLRGASVLLCGATGGIGTALALELHSRGAALTLAARNASRLASLPVPGARIVGDLRSAEACTQAVNLAASQTGGLNVLINAVGVVAFGSTAELPTDENTSSATNSCNGGSAADQRARRDARGSSAHGAASRRSDREHIRRDRGAEPSGHFRLRRIQGRGACLRPSAGTRGASQQGAGDRCPSATHRHGTRRSPDRRPGSSPGRGHCPRACRERDL